jgi:hypothetical protein
LIEGWTNPLRINLFKVCSFRLVVAVLFLSEMENLRRPKLPQGALSGHIDLRTPGCRWEGQSLRVDKWVRVVLFGP